MTGGVVSFIGAGTCVVDANQAGNAGYTAAPQVQQSFAVAGGTTPQTISFSSAAPVGATVAGTYTPAATATSGLGVSLTADAASSAVCSMTGGVVSFIGAGTCVIDANQAGNTTYAPAPQVQQSFGVVAATLPAPSFTLTAGAGSLAINAFPAVPNASSYSYQVCNAVGASCGAGLTITTSGTTITGLLGGTSYVVKLTAVGNGTTYISSVPATQTGVPSAVPLATPSFTLTAGTGSLTINPFNALPNATSYSYAVCNAVGASCGTAIPVTTAGATISGLTDGTPDTITLTAIGDGTVYANSAAASVVGTPGVALAPGPTPLIIDTDIYSDADDVGSLATAFALQLKGEANVVATIVNTRTDRPAVATNSWKCTAAVTGSSTGRPTRCWARICPTPARRPTRPISSGRAPASPQGRSRPPTPRSTPTARRSLRSPTAAW